MKDSKNTLLQDTLSFLRDSFDPKDCFAVLPTSPLLIRPTHLQKKTIETPKPIIEIPKPKNLPKEEVLDKKKEEPLPKIQRPEIKQEPPLSFSHLAPIIQKLFPGYPLKETPLPNQTAFLQILSAECVIFSFKESPQSDLFLKNLEKAISCCNSSSKIFDFATNSSAEDLQLFFQESLAKVILASPLLLQTPALLPFIKEFPTTQERFF